MREKRQLRGIAWIAASFLLAAAIVLAGVARAAADEGPPGVPVAPAPPPPVAPPARVAPDDGTAPDGHDHADPRSRRDRLAPPTPGAGPERVTLDGEYHTPLAGEAFQTRVFGVDVDIAPRDRGDTFALTLGALAFHPKLGDTTYTPLAAFYWKRLDAGWRGRAIVSVFVNELDFAWSLPPLEGRSEALLHLENHTVPFASKEIIDGRTLDETSLEWGNVTVWPGIGLRYPVAPFQVDSDVRLQLFYVAGYFYAERRRETPRASVLPSDTFYQGARLRLRYDGLRRNLLELPHAGFAAGGDAELIHRDRWHDHGGPPPLAEVKARDSRDYLKLSGYLIAALPVPYVSERHRLVGMVHGGIAPERELDRYSTFRLGGGPFPSETDDLYRHPYPGAAFGQIESSGYILMTLEYRFELLFFLYLHARATFAIGNTPAFEESQLRLTRGRGESISAALTSGFLWQSSIYFEYGYDTGALRNGPGGSSFLFMWSKAL